MSDNSTDRIQELKNRIRELEEKRDGRGDVRIVQSVETVSEQPPARRAPTAVMVGCMVVGLVCFALWLAWCVNLFDTAAAPARAPSPNLPASVHR